MAPMGQGNEAVARLQILSNERLELLDLLVELDRKLSSNKLFGDRSERDQQKAALVLRLGHNRRLAQVIWLKESRELESFDRSFAVEMDRISRRSEAGLPQAPHSAVGSVFAPLVMRTGIPAWLFALLTIVIVAVSRDSGDSGKGWWEWVSRFIAVIAVSCGVVSTTFGWRADRRATKASKNLSEAAENTSQE